MSDPHDNIPSPCIRVCKVDIFEGWCEGCYRTLDEIASWSSSSREEREAVLIRIQARKKERPPAAVPKFLGTLKL
jgi:predicted Fe-S protein YdhL (DUF1289 family)